MSSTPHIDFHHTMSCDSDYDCSMSGTRCYSCNTTWIIQGDPNVVGSFGNRFDDDNSDGFPTRTTYNEGDSYGQCGCATAIGFTNINGTVFPGIDCALYTFNPPGTFWLVTCLFLLVLYTMAAITSGRGLYVRLTTIELGRTRWARMDDANSFSFLSYLLGSMLGMLRAIIWMVMISGSLPYYNSALNVADACMVFGICFYTGGMLFVSLVWLEMARSIARLNPNPSVRPGRRIAACILITWFVALIPCFANGADNNFIAAFVTAPFFAIVYCVFYLGSVRVCRLCIPSDTPLYLTYFATPKPSVEAGYYSIRRTTVGALLSQACMISFAIVEMHLARYDPGWMNLAPPGEISIVSVIEQVLNFSVVFGAAFVLFFLHGKLRKSIYLRKQMFTARSSSKENERGTATSPMKRQSTGGPWIMREISFGDGGGGGGPTTPKSPGAFSDGFTLENSSPFSSPRSLAKKPSPLVTKTLGNTRSVKPAQIVQHSSHQHDPDDNNDEGSKTSRDVNKGDEHEEEDDMEGSKETIAEDMSESSSKLSKDAIATTAATTSTGLDADVKNLHDSPDVRNRESLAMI